MINLKTISKKTPIAFVGASNNPDKYGYKVMKDIMDKGYNCIPINPRENEILGQKAYPNLTAAAKALESSQAGPVTPSDSPGASTDNKAIALVDFIVPPAVTLEVLKEVKALGLKNVWMQPGSESPEAIKYCLDNGIDCIHNACIMIETDKQES